MLLISFPPLSIFLINTRSISFKWIKKLSASTLTYCFFHLQLHIKVPMELKMRMTLLIQLSVHYLWKYYNFLLTCTHVKLTLIADIRWEFGCQCNRWPSKAGFWKLRTVASCENTSRQTLWLCSICWQVPFWSLYFNSTKIIMLIWLQW